jgi:hypothetical protein
MHEKDPRFNPLDHALDEDSELVTLFLAKWRISSEVEGDPEEVGAGGSSSHWLAGAKPSRLVSEMPLTTVWLILTTPRRDRKAFSSICSWARVHNGCPTWLSGPWIAR